MAATSPLCCIPLITRRSSVPKPTPKKLTTNIQCNQIYSSIAIPSETEFSDREKSPGKKIPGDYGHPFLGPIKDRHDYFYNQGRNEFFKSRIEKYGSTIFRVNMPPGPPIASDSQAIALLDGKSFPVLFDTSKVSKKDVFTGTYVPSLDLTGGYRMLPYLDPSEPNHTPLKNLMFKLVNSTRHRVLPEFHSVFSNLFNELENELASKGKAKFNQANDEALINFLSRAWFNANPAESELGDSASSIISKWVLFQIGPIVTLGLPMILEELTIHSFRLPFALIKKDYYKLYNFIYTNASSLLDEAVKLGISKDEACHNLIFTTCLNAFGGLKIFFPNMIKHIGQAGLTLHQQLAIEVRSAVRSHGGEVTMAAMNQMPLVNSVVYECFRIEPPVPFQYGRARKDFTIESHDAEFEIKEGELLFGYQSFATKDPKIFDRADEFVPDRFIGDHGEKMLKHLVWSNGPHTENPTTDNKQCAGKELVVFMARLLLIEMFLKYDSFEIDVGYSPLGANITFTTLIKHDTS